MNVYWSKKYNIYHFDSIYFTIKGKYYMLTGNKKIDGEVVDEFKDLTTGKHYKMKRSQLGEKLVAELHNK